MRKVLPVFLIYLCCTAPAFAVITPKDSISEDYIINHGHSSEMARLIDLQNSQINNIKPTYKSNEPAYYSDNRVKVIRNIFRYLDCGLDDGKFMQHDIYYTPKWNDL